MKAFLHLQEVRRDGRRIDESMTLDQLLGLGWPPDRVVRLEWQAGQQTVVVDAPHGVLAKVLADRRSIAVLTEVTGDARSPARLTVLNEDGSTRVEIPNRQTIAHEQASGQFLWFEPPRSGALDEFGAVFQRDSDRAQFQIDFEAHTGRVVDIRATR